jgi:hypothetical protein
MLAEGDYERVKKAGWIASLDSALEGLKTLNHIE